MIISEPCEEPMIDLFHVFSCQNIIIDKTWFKNQHSHCLIVTNSPKSFQNFTVIETCLSDFHKM